MTFEVNVIGDVMEDTRSDGHTLQETLTLQGDTMSLQAAGITPELLTLAATLPGPLSATEQALIDALTGWQFTCPTGLSGHEPTSAALTGVENTESIGCSAYHVLLVNLAEAVFYDDFEAAGHAAAFSVFSVEEPLYRLIADPTRFVSGQAVWDDLSTTEVEDATATLEVALSEAALLIESLLGSDPQQWQWGRAHTITLRSIFNVPNWNIGPYASEGAMISVNLGAFSWESSGFDHIHGPYLRLVVEMTEDGHHPPLRREPQKPRHDSRISAGTADLQRFHSHHRS